MLDSIISLNGTSVKGKVACKMAVSAFLIALAVILPQLVHVILGQPGGVKWLPMYLPVLIGGCLLGTRWAFFVGMMSPLVSFIVTSSMGEAMPNEERLPFMMFELAVFAAVSGAFSEKIIKNALWAFAAVITAQLAGRLTFLGIVFIFREHIQLAPAMVWSQIQAGMPGIILQLALVPLFAILLRGIFLKENVHD